MYSHNPVPSSVSAPDGIIGLGKSLTIATVSHECSQNSMNVGLVGRISFLIGEGVTPAACFLQSSFLQAGNAVVCCESFLSLSAPLPCCAVSQCNVNSACQSSCLVILFLVWPL